MTSPSHSSGSLRRVASAAAFGGSWLGVAALALWAAHPAGWLLPLAAAGLLAGVRPGSAGSRARALGSVVLLGGILAGFSAHRQVGRVLSDWDAYWSGREAAVGARLDAALERELRSAEDAASALAAMSVDSVPSTSAPLARLRGQFDVTALALYSAAGDLLAWDGVHRGRVPEEVQRGLRRYAYGDLPLFGYLYVTAPTAVGGTAVAAVLLRADLPGALAAGGTDFASRFLREVGEPIRLVGYSPAATSPGWDWKLGDRTLFTVVVDPPTPAERGAQVLARWQVRVAAVAVGAWLLLAVGTSAARAGAVAASGVLFLLAAVLPFQRLASLAPLFDAEAFALPGPLPLTLGRSAALVLALVPLAGVLPAPRRRLSPLQGSALVAVVVPLLVAWLAAAPSHSGLTRAPLHWLTYQGVVAVALTLALGMSLALCRAQGARAQARAWAPIPVALLLGAGAAALVWRTASVPAWWPALWAVPFGLVAVWGAPWPGARGALAAWVTAGVLAGTVAIPEAWSHQVDARRAQAVEQLRRMAAPEDAELEGALRRLGETAASLARDGREGVGLLYGAWRASGLADMGAPAWLTLWSPAGIPEEELRVGLVDRPPVSYEVQESRGSQQGPRILRYDRDDARYVLRSTLPDGEILTAAVPPFADPAFRAGLSPLLSGGSPEARSSLTLIPVAAWEGSRDVLRWRRTPVGWRAELPLMFSNALYQAHYDVALPGLLLGTARATLLLLANLGVFLGLRALGRGFLGESVPRDLHWSELVIPFRSRVTLALFGFFVLAVALFGTLAYRTIAGASWRTAQVLAERVAEDAAGWYIEAGGRMQALSRRVGVELLEYRAGELRDGSMEELVELGLYEGWLPMDVFRRLKDREDIRDVEQAELGTWGYVSAFRRLPDGDVVAAQVPRQAGATAIRSADVLELLAFAVLVGAALSLGLALLVARALTSPIQALQVASERVGAGNLALSLPSDRSDEFGAVFRAFNRMVGRLRRARRQLVRTSRRTKTIMEEAAVGMLALDPGGRVTLANPRAGELLGGGVGVGDLLPGGGPLGDELRRWLEEFLRSRREEAGVELQEGARRIRVRARRLGTPEARGGAVVALEDVTDELQTERVLAWGEMARQIAHEVKNPLTPMKLSVQHIRRAWEDQRPDFEGILFRNAAAMEEEIDRLAAIAKSFSRFGAPTGTGEAPLESVDVALVVREVLALYRGSEAPVAFEGSVPEGLPPAWARVTEMKEVLVNLLENARVASPPGSTVSIAAEEDGTGALLVHVVDQGRGIPDAFKARVFEPQFSTRSTGAGLGLAIVRRLVESWGGSVGIESGDGVGTRVTLQLRTGVPTS
ncbi:MAG: hypothetical protein AMXMBFR53_10320 [Gemmatimonadota bacterium]